VVDEYQAEELVADGIGVVVGIKETATSRQWDGAERRSA
jgi:hypothetical protein